MLLNSMGVLKSSETETKACELFTVRVGQDDLMSSFEYAAALESV